MQLSIGKIFIAIVVPILTAITGAVVSSIINGNSNAAVRSIATEASRQECLTLIEQRDRTYLSGVRDEREAILKQIKAEEESHPLPIIIKKK
jgi:hypothetical protein